MKTVLNILFYCLVFTYAPSHGFAQTQTEKVPGVMAPLSEEILKLQPYIVSEKRFTDPKNSKNILSSLKTLQSLSKSLPMHDRLKTPGFEISAQLLQKQLSDAYTMFQSGSKSLARKYVNSSLKACSSCHTQVAQQASPQWAFPVSRVAGSLIEQANFWYTVRHYQKALDLYEQVVLQFPSPTTSLTDVEDAFEKTLAVYVRVRRSPGKALQSFQRFLKNTKLPDSAKARLQGWIEEIKTMNYGDAPSSRTASSKEIESYAAKKLVEAEKKSFQKLDDSQMVQFLFVSGLLYEFINFNPKKATAEILYWLAICDHWLNDQFYFSLSDLYLKECIQRFPSSPTALKCYKEFEEKTKLSFTGSSGLHIPSDVKAEMQKYKSMLKPQKKK